MPWAQFMNFAWLVRIDLSLTNPRFPSFVGALCYAHHEAKKGSFLPALPFLVATRISLDQRECHDLFIFFLGKEGEKGNRL